MCFGVAWTEQGQLFNGHWYLATIGSCKMGRKGDTHEGILHKKVKTKLLTHLCHVFQGFSQAVQLLPFGCQLEGYKHVVIRTTTFEKVLTDYFYTLGRPFRAVHLIRIIWCASTWSNVWFWKSVRYGLSGRTPMYKMFVQRTRHLRIIPKELGRFKLLDSSVGEVFCGWPANFSGMSAWRTCSSGRRNKNSQGRDSQTISTLSDDSSCSAMLIDTSDVLSKP